MEVLWSPWRSKYIETFKDEEKHYKENPCFFCEAIEMVGKEAEYLVVARREKCFAMLNKFPYNNGHTLVAPYRHIGELSDLTDDELVEMMKLIRQITEMMKEVYQPHGFNIGANLGRESGAGVPGHLHFHIVPRWNGDTSFMAVLSDVKVVSQALEETQTVFFEKLLETK